ncbi:MAG: NYN domain-containing protein [Pseudomonadota bacterium]
MQSVATTPILSAVFVDYDNIYLSLRRKNEEAAKRFAKDAPRWIAALQTGALITPTQPALGNPPRRLVMNRCYGNPVPRRNPSDNSTDMSSFPFVRHNFLRAGFEIVDCPPLTAQLKNSSDIKMVMDLRDFLTHATHFEEFIILSSDADFTPVLHRLRAHNRRTVIFANDNTAAPYTALADGEVREMDLIDLLIGELTSDDATENDKLAQSRPIPLESVRENIVAVVADLVRNASQPLPLEALAQQTTELMGRELTVETDWGGKGFLDLLRTALPDDLGLSGQQPPVVFDRKRLKPQAPQKALEQPSASPAPSPITAVPERQEPALAEPKPQPTRLPELDQPTPAPTPAPSASAAPQPAAPEPEPVEDDAETVAQEAAKLQRWIAKIYDASQAPPISPTDYRILFEEMAGEITDNELQGVQTIANVVGRAAERGVSIPHKDVRFILDVVGEADPWFEQGATANQFAGRFRNFVVARCRSQGLSLSVEELDFIEAWFASPPEATQSADRQRSSEKQLGSRWWDEPDVVARPDATAEAASAEQSAYGGGGLQADEDVPREDMPRFVRSHPRL